MVHGAKYSGLPSITDAFTHNTRVKRALVNAGFTSLRQVAMMSREALIELPGIKVSTAAHIVRTLKEQYGLRSRVLSVKLSDYLTQFYGCVEDAPIGALQLIVVRDRKHNRTLFAPLEVITYFEKMHPDMTIVQLICCSLEGVRRSVQALVEDDEDIQIHNLDEDLRHLVARLDYFGISFAEEKLELADEIELAEGIVAPRHLHTVH